MSDTTDELFGDLRPLLFSIAYRMLGSVGEAEDSVQEAFIRFHRAREDGERVESPKAWLSTVVTRLSIDQLRSARARREQYVGAWLPEPLLTDEADASAHAEMADSLSLAFLVLLERLSPVERAVLLLHDVFGYDYGEVAGVVGRSEANCRQLAVRARRHVEEGRTRFEASREQRERLAERFFAATQEGDTDSLLSLLAEDVVLYGDGGGNAPSIPKPLHGREKVARMLLGLTRQAVRHGLRMRRAEVNGQPGATLHSADGLLISVLALDIAEGRVQGIRSMLNPDKLGHLGPLADANELLRSRGRG
jgi:RNA polymerase sigma-70 factor (ECF subfamily)